MTAVIIRFDHVQVSHYSGQEQEEDYYYLFGLTLGETAAAATQPYKLTIKEEEKALFSNVEERKGYSQVNALSKINENHP